MLQPGVLQPCQIVLPTVIQYCYVTASALRMLLVSVELQVQALPLLTASLKLLEPVVCVLLSSTSEGVRFAASLHKMHRCHVHPGTLDTHPCCHAPPVTTDPPQVSCLCNVQAHLIIVTAAVHERGPSTRRGQRLLVAEPEGRTLK